MYPLKIPWRAKKAFDQAGELKEMRDFNRSTKKLNQAIRIYPAMLLPATISGSLMPVSGTAGARSKCCGKRVDEPPLR